MRDALRAFELDPKQQFARRIERPRVAQLAVLHFGNAPDRRRARLRAASARANPQRPRLATIRTGPPRAGLAAHPLHRGRQIRIHPFRMMRVAAALDKSAHRAGILGLA